MLQPADVACEIQREAAEPAAAQVEEQDVGGSMYRPMAGQAGAEVIGAGWSEHGPSREDIGRE